MTKLPYVDVATSKVEWIVSVSMLNAVRQTCVDPLAKSVMTTLAADESIHSRFGWTLTLHHTDRPASEPLLTLIMRLQGMADDYRWKPQASAPAGGTGGTP